MDLPDEIKFLQQDHIDKQSDRRQYDSGESGDEGDKDGDEGDDALPHTNFPEQMLKEQPTIRNAGNTGPKGVLADYAEAKEQLRQRREAEKAEAWRKIEKMAITVNNNNNNNNINSNNNNNNDEDEEDDEFIRQYRQKRLLEMQHGAKPTFGFLRAIDSSEYIDALEKEHKEVFVVVHLYKNEFKDCVKLNLILQNLAIKYPFVKFLKIISTEANPKYDDVGLPSLLVYRGGELVHCWVPITTKIGKNFDSDDVEILLARSKVIKSSVEKTQVIHKEKTKDVMYEYDDDIDEVSEGED